MYRLSVVMTKAAGGGDAHVDLNVDADLAKQFRSNLVRTGFNHKGKRVFSDGIETVMLYELDENGKPGEFI